MRREHWLFACTQLRGGRGGGYYVSILFSLKLLHSDIQQPSPFHFIVELEDLNQFLTLACFSALLGVKHMTFFHDTFSDIVIILRHHIVTLLSVSQFICKTCSRSSTRLSLVPEVCASLYKFHNDTNFILLAAHAGMPELTDLALHAQCKRDLIGECERGTVTMDPWVNDTLAFQRQLGHNTTIDKLQILGSHNSFNDKADG